MFIMHSFALFFRASIGTLPDGLTVSDEPIQRSKSQAAAC